MKKKILKFMLMFIFLMVSSGYAKKEKWEEHKATHFIIYYQNAPKDFVETVEEMAEYYYKEIADNLGFTRYKGWTYDKRASIYIYNDVDHYRSAARAYQWSHGVASPKDKVIRTFPSAHGFFDSTLPHELGHIVFREFVGFKAEVPPWFEEGVAMYQEKAKRWGAHDEVRKAMAEENFIPLDELSLLRLYSNTDKRLVDLFYAESASVVNYMINDLGKQRFVRFCRKLEKGSPFDWTLHDVYVRFKTVRDLNKAWVSYLKR